MDFSDFEETDDIFSGDEQDMAPEPGPSAPFRRCDHLPGAHLMGGVLPPWIGHGGKLVGVVDVGSNGIRFSISELSSALARILPTVLVYRSSISLYDTQFDPQTGKRIPIPAHIIDSVCTVLGRFVVICEDIGVKKEDIHVVATEATRTALNSAAFMKAIHEKTGLSLQLLPKEEEGQIGALGIASGFSNMAGLVMDLGGGSTQISWMISQGGEIRTSPHGSFSFPYGAAALTKKLHDIQHGKKKEDKEVAVKQFRTEMIKNFRDAYHRLQVPRELVETAQREGGFQIYLSGGGFRGWGYLLLYLNQSGEEQYPISIINGYTAGRKQFEDTDTIEKIAKAAKDVFRISDRRRSQVPAVAFLVNVLAEAIPNGINEAHFCQGGVREGYLFKQLPIAVRQQSPLEVATSFFAPDSRVALQALLKTAIPAPSATKRFPEAFGLNVIESFANAMYVHMFMSKETASTTALYSTSVGLMSTIHGVSHRDRARLALMLESRYQGELPPRELAFRELLRKLITPEEVWWASYLGRVGYLVTRLYPGGKIHKAYPRVVFSSQWSWSLGKDKDKEGLLLTISLQRTKEDKAKIKDTLHGLVRAVEKVGKKKNWIEMPKEDPWGLKVKVEIVEEGILEDVDIV